MIHTEISSLEGSVLQNYIRNSDDLKYLQCIMPPLVAESVAHRRSQALLHLPLGIPNVTVIQEILSEASDVMELLKSADNFAFRSAYDKAVSTIIASYNIQSQAIEALQDPQDYVKKILNFTDDLKDTVSKYIANQPLPKLDEDVLKASGRAMASLQQSITSLIMVGVYLNISSEEASTENDWLTPPSSSTGYESFLSAYSMFRNVTGPALSDANNFDLKALFSFAELSVGGTRGHKFMFLHGIKTTLSSHTLPLRASDMAQIMLNTSVDSMKREGVYTRVGNHKKSSVSEILKKFTAEHFSVSVRRDVPYPTFYEYWALLEVLIGGVLWSDCVDRARKYIEATQVVRDRVGATIVTWLSTHGSTDSVDVGKLSHLIMHIEDIRRDFALSLLDVDSITRLPRLSVGLQFNQPRAQNTVAIFEKAAAATIIREFYPIGHICYVLKDVLQHVPAPALQFATDPFLGNYLAVDGSNYYPLIYAPLASNRAIHIDDLNDFEFWKRQNHLKKRIYDLTHTVKELGRVKEVDPEVPRADEFLRLINILKTYTSDNVSLDIGFFPKSSDTSDIKTAYFAQAHANSHLIGLEDSDGAIPGDNLDDISMHFGVGDKDIISFLISSRHPSGSFFANKFLRDGKDLGITLTDEKLGIFLKPAIRTVNAITQLTHMYEYFGKLMPLAIASRLGLDYQFLHNTNDVNLMQAQTLINVEKLSPSLRNLRLLVVVTYGSIIPSGVIERDPVLSTLIEKLSYRSDGSLDLDKLRWSTLAQKFFTESGKADHTLYGLDSTSLVLLNHDISIPQMQMTYIDSEALGVFPIIVTTNTNFFDPVLYEQWINKGNGDGGDPRNRDSSDIELGADDLTDHSYAYSKRFSLLASFVTDLVGHKDRILPYIDVIKITAPSLLRLRSAIANYTLSAAQPKTIAETDAKPNPPIKDEQIIPRPGDKLGEVDPKPKDKTIDPAPSEEEVVVDEEDKTI
jgi:hypothetical protein